MRTGDGGGSCFSDDDREKRPECVFSSAPMLVPLSAPGECFDSSVQSDSSPDSSRLDERRSAIIADRNEFVRLRTVRPFAPNGGDFSADGGCGCSGDVGAELASDKPLRTGNVTDVGDEGANQDAASVVSIGAATTFVIDVDDVIGRCKLTNDVAGDRNIAGVDGGARTNGQPETVGASTRGITENEGQPRMFKRTEGFSSSSPLVPSKK
jgi:hypothetical protein